MRPDNKEVADKLREMADLLDLGHARVLSASVTDERHFVMTLDGSHFMPRYRPDYLQVETRVEGATEGCSLMEATVSWRFSPKS